MGPAGWYFWPYFNYWLSRAGIYPYAPYPPYPSFFSAEQEIEFLESQIKLLEEELAGLNQRLEELKKNKGQDK
ncbi:MAG: DUF5320 domain-containing protein [Candidatus Aminicenantes bacterium]|nr:DUF5320 domain-containing protein [Candidatus Aminicenantes bacterium]